MELLGWLNAGSLITQNTAAAKNRRGGGVRERVAEDDMERVDSLNAASFLDGG